VALEKLEGCSDAYVDPGVGITLLFSIPRALDENSLAALLKPLKVRVSEVKKVNKLPY
jgi:hypothetical protein